MNLMKSQTSHCKESLTFVLALTRMFDSTCLRSSTIVSAHGREAPLWWRWKWLGRSRSSASPGRVLVSDHDMQRCSKGRQVRHFQAWVWRQPTKTTRNNQRQTCIYDAYMVCHDLYVHTFHIQRLYILLLYYFFLLTFCFLTFDIWVASCWCFSPNLLYLVEAKIQGIPTNCRSRRTKPSGSWQRTATSL